MDNSTRGVWCIRSRIYMCMLVCATSGPKVAMRLIRHLLLGVIIIMTALIVVYRDTLLCAGSDGRESLASMDSGDASLPRGRESCQTTGLGIFCFVLALMPPVLSTLLLPNIISNFVSVSERKNVSRVAVISLPDTGWPFSAGTLSRPLNQSHAVTLLT